MTASQHFFITFTGSHKYSALATYANPLSGQLSQVYTKILFMTKLIYSLCYKQVEKLHFSLVEREFQLGDNNAASSIESKLLQ